MMCLITNCNHKKSNRMRHMNRTCWDLWQICPCCVAVLVELGIIEYKSTNSPTGCLNSIAKELYVEPKPDQELIAKIQLKKKYPRKMSFEGVAM